MIKWILPGVGIDWRAHVDNGTIIIDQDRPVEDQPEEHDEVVTYWLEVGRRHRE